MPTQTPLPPETDILIIGGGIWGLSTAFHLAKPKSAGRITLLERNAQLASETTRQAAGQIGQLRSHPVMARAVRYTLDLLTHFEDEYGHDPGLQTPGSVHLALTSERMGAFRRQKEIAAELGIALEFLKPSEVRDIVPDANTANIEGAVFVIGDGYVDARHAAFAYASVATVYGADLRTGVSVDAVTFDDRQSAWLVQTSSTTIRARHVIVTAGPWTAFLSQALGVQLPVCGIRLQQARTVAHPSMAADHPVVRIPDVSCYLRPENGGFLYGYFDSQPLIVDPREKPAGFATADITPAHELVAESARRLEPLFPILRTLAIDEYRQGMVTCAPDGWYVLGPVTDLPGLWLATGCAGMGIAGSGAVGKWLADWIINGDPGEDLQFMSPQRLPQIANDWNALKQESRRTFSNYYSLRGGATYSMGTTENE